MHESCIWQLDVCASTFSGEAQQTLCCRLMRFARVLRLIRQLLTSVIYASISFEVKWLRWLKLQSVM